MSDERGYRRWLRLGAQSRQDLEREIDEEIESHAALHEQALLAGGATPERARQEAVRRAGQLRSARPALIRNFREQQDATRRRETLDGWRRDFSYALRRARRAPLHSLFAVLTFALAIGLCTAMYTIVDGVLLRALPFSEPDRLVALYSVGERGEATQRVSAANWRDWAESNRTLESSAIHRERRMAVRPGNQALRVPGALVSPDFFRVLRARMTLGRVPAAEEWRQGGVAIVSEAFWRTVLGAEPALRTPLTIDGAAYTIIGVLSAAHTYPQDTDVWLPDGPPPQGGAARNWINYEAIARLAPGATIEQARQDLDAIAGHVRATDPVGIYSYGVDVRPLKQRIVGDAGGYLSLLLGAVAFVLLIACANLASINLARGVARQRELAVRTALGAGRFVLVRQVLIEHLVLAVMGGALGIVLARWAVRVALDEAALFLPRLHDIALDLRVLAVAAAATVGAGLLTGLLPALRLTGASLREQMGVHGRGTVQGGRGTPGALLVASEIALALVLLTGGGLLMRSYQVVLQRPLGFEVERLATAQIDLPVDAYPADRTMSYWEAALARLRALPGVSAAAAANWVPLGMGGMTFVDIENRPDLKASAGYRAVSDDYFRTLNIPLLSGRPVEERDQRGTQRVAVINQRMAEAFWPNESPIGKRIRASSMELLPDEPPPQWLTVIGVVGTIRHFGQETEPDPELYVSVRQVPFWSRSMTAVLRTAGPAERLLPALRSELRAIDPLVPADVRTQHERHAETLRWRRLLLTLLATFAGVALLLAAIGIYSLLSFSVAQRTREIAIRAALGAQRSALLRLVFAQAMFVVAIGAAAGLLAGLGLTRFMTSLLADVSPLDPLTFAAGTLFLLLVAGLAAALPSRRATRLDPLLALQSD